MNFRGVSRHVTKPEFWRGFGRGFNSSFKRSFRNYYRIAFYSSLAGSFIALRLVRRFSSHAETTGSELEIAVGGALVAIVFVYLYRWFIRRMNTGSAG